MGFKEVAALDAEVTISIGKKDKTTGKAYPKQAEGYYLGNRTVQNKRGESKLHFLQTEAGNLGVWGTTDLNRKLQGVTPGTMVRITSTGTKPTPNGDMYTYKVELDTDNTIEVDMASNESAAPTYESSEDDSSNDETDSDQDEDEAQQVFAAKQEANKRKVQELLNRKSK